MRYSLIIPAWNARDELVACLESARRQRLDAPLETIVVDNASTDGTFDAIDGLRDVRAIRNEENVGYAAGMNQGARAAAGDVLFLANSDIVLLGDDALQRLGDALRSRGVGLAGPRYVWPDGSLQPGCANHPSVGRALLMGSGLHRALPDRARARVVPEHWSHDRSRATGWIMGALLAIRADLFAAVGGFWPLIYGSEQDLAWKVGQRGLAIRYVSEARVVHVVNASNRQRYSEPEKAGRIATSELAFLARHYRRPRAEAIRAITGLGFAARALALRALGRRARAREYAAMARAYARGLGAAAAYLRAGRF